MLKMQKGYLLKDRGLIVIDKASVINAKDDEFEEISIVLPMKDIKLWAEEIDLMDLDYED